MIHDGPLGNYSREFPCTERAKPSAVRSLLSKVTSGLAVLAGNLAEYCSDQTDTAKPRERVPVGIVFASPGIRIPAVSATSHCGCMPMTYEGNRGTTVKFNLVAVGTEDQSILIDFEQQSISVFDRESKRFRLVPTERMILPEAISVGNPVDHPLIRGTVSYVAVSNLKDSPASDDELSSSLRASTLAVLEKFADKQIVTKGGTGLTVKLPRL